MVDLRRQYAAIKPEIDEAVRRVVESGYYSSGPEVRAFEEAWAAYCGVTHCVALANGTDSLNFEPSALVQATKSSPSPSLSALPSTPSSTLGPRLCSSISTPIPTR
jgi:dTDP-4-amino-4,6-dideoxygalactose transaminase